MRYQVGFKVMMGMFPYYEDQVLSTAWVFFSLCKSADYLFGLLHGGKWANIWSLIWFHVFFDFGSQIIFVLKGGGYHCPQE